MARCLRTIPGLLVLLMMAGFLGCGGGSPTTLGSIGLAVTFPPRDEQTGTSANGSMPRVTNSVRIRVETTDDAASPWSRERIIDRPARRNVVRCEIDSVPAGYVLITATCFDGFGATGNLVAEASSIHAVRARQVARVTMVTDRLAASVQIYPVPMPGGDRPPPLVSVELEPTQYRHVQAKGWDYDAAETIYVDFRWEGEGLNLSPLTGSVVAVHPMVDGQYRATVSDAKSGQQATLDVDVVSRPVASVNLSPTEATLYRFGTPNEVMIVAVALDERDEPIEYAALSYQSDDPGVAAVDETGLVTPRGAGTCTVTVIGSTATGSAQATCEVLVIDTGNLDVIVRQVPSRSSVSHENSKNAGS
ncbi:MAG: Ig-like domain-containing protein [Armatimonadota bacterium]|jgi:hypothetical protein